MVIVLGLSPPKTVNKETQKPIFHGIVPGLSQDCPGIFLRFPCNFVFMCFPFHLEKGKHINKFDPHPFPGQSPKVVYVYWFSSHPENPRVSWALRARIAEKVNKINLLGQLAP